MDFLREPTFWIGGLIALAVLFALEWVPAYHQLSGWRVVVIDVLIIFVILSVVRHIYSRFSK